MIIANTQFWGSRLISKTLIIAKDSVFDSCRTLVCGIAKLKFWTPQAQQLQKAPLASIFPAQSLWNDYVSLRI